VVAIALLVGVTVATIARWSAGSSCPAYEDPAMTPCTDLVASLAARIGAVAAAAVIFLDLLSTGLLRTFRTMADERRSGGQERA
jgi:hypothetical protein